MGLAGATQPADGLLTRRLQLEQLAGAPEPLPVPADSQSSPVLLSIFLNQTQAAQPGVTQVKEEGTGRRRVSLHIFHFLECSGTVLGNSYLFLDRHRIGYFSSLVWYSWSATVSPSSNRSWWRPWFRRWAQRSLQAPAHRPPAAHFGGKAKPSRL